MKKPVLERVEDLTTELYGRGAAVSVNDEDGKCVVRCWDRPGFAQETVARKHRVLALQAAETLLKLSLKNKEKEDE